LGYLLSVDNNTYKRKNTAGWLKLMTYFLYQWFSAVGEKPQEEKLNKGKEKD